MTGRGLLYGGHLPVPHGISRHEEDLGIEAHCKLNGLRSSRRIIVLDLEM